MGKPKQKDFEKNKLRLGKGRGLKKQSVTHTPLTVKTRRAPFLAHAGTLYSQ